MLTFGGGIGMASPPRTQFQTPQIVGTVTRLSTSVTAAYSSLSFPGHSSPTGNVLVMFFSRAVVNNPGGFDSVTWGGSALTEVLDFERAQPPSASGSVAGWAGWIRGGPTGAQNVVVTPTGTDFEDLIGWAISFDRLAASPIGDSAGAAAQGVAAAYSTGVTAMNSGSRLIGAIAVNNENLSPMNANAGWTIRDQGKTGNSGGGDIAAILAQRTADAAVARTLTGQTSTALTWDEWGGMLLEILPA